MLAPCRIERQKLRCVPINLQGRRRRIRRIRAPTVHTSGSTPKVRARIAVPYSERDVGCTLEAVDAHIACSKLLEIAVRIKPISQLLHVIATS